MLQNTSREFSLADTQLPTLAREIAEALCNQFFSQFPVSKHIWWRLFADEGRQAS